MDLNNMNEEEYYKWLANIFNWCPFVVVHYPEALYKISHYTGKFPERVVSWVYNSNTAKQHRDIAFFDIIPISGIIVTRSPHIVLYKF